MNYPKYDIKTSDEMEMFEFTSIGPKGEINKVILFQETDDPAIYNLAFGDLRSETIDGEESFFVDDSIRSQMEIGIKYWPQ